MRILVESNPLKSGVLIRRLARLFQAVNERHDDAGRTEVERLLGCRCVLLCVLFVFVDVMSLLVDFVYIVLRSILLPSMFVLFVYYDLLVERLLDELRAVQGDADEHRHANLRSRECRMRRCKRGL